MFVVNVEINKVRESDSGSVSLYVERKRGDHWNREKVIDLTPGAPDSKRKILVEDDQRIVFQGNMQTAVVFDKVQNAAVPVKHDEAETRRLVSEENARIEADRAEEDRIRRENIAKRDVLPPEPLSPTQRFQQPKPVVPNKPTPTK